MRLQLVKNIGRNIFLYTMIKPSHKRRNIRKKKTMKWHKNCWLWHHNSDLRRYNSKILQFEFRNSTIPNPLIRDRWPHSATFCENLKWQHVQLAWNGGKKEYTWYNLLFHTFTVVQVTRAFLIVYYADLYEKINQQQSVYFSDSSLS